MLDSTTLRLFSPFDNREVANPRRQIIHSLYEFERFITNNNGSNNCFVSVHPLSGEITDIFYDFDGDFAIIEGQKVSGHFKDVGLQRIPVDSGVKGIHLHIPLKIKKYNYPDGGKDLLLQASWKLLGNINEGHPWLSLDSKVLGDIRRITRIPNTLRPPDNNTWCTYLPDDWEDMSEVEIIHHRKQPHHEYDYQVERLLTLNDIVPDYEYKKTDSPEGSPNGNNSSGASIGGGDSGYNYIYKLLMHPVSDGRQRITWLIIAPFLINVMNYDVSNAANIARNWVEMCNRLGHTEAVNEVMYYVRNAKERQLFPPKYQTLKMQHPEIYSIISSAIGSDMP